MVVKNLENLGKMKTNLKSFGFSVASWMSCLGTFEGPGSLIGPQTHSLFLSTVLRDQTPASCFSLPPSTSVSHFFFQEYARLFPIVFLSVPSLEGILCSPLFRTEKSTRGCVTSKHRTGKPNSNPRLSLSMPSYFSILFYYPFFLWERLSRPP